MAILVFCIRLKLDVLFEIGRSVFILKIWESDGNPIWEGNLTMHFTLVEALIYAPLRFMDAGRNIGYIIELQAPQDSSIAVRSLQ